MWAVLALAGAAVVFGGAAIAHPHVFIDTGVEVIFDDAGLAAALRISWTYDDLYSLMIIADRGLDADFDGALTAEEETALSGFDMDWDEGFPGDTYALKEGAALALSRPADWTARYQGGRITSTHLRRFAEPVPVGAVPLVVQVYDPSFYSAYTIASAPVLTGGAACRTQVFEPDRAAADARLLAAMEELSGSADAEADFPAIGDAYAEEVRITCAAPS